jgi:membrane protease subunit HflC
VKRLITILVVAGAALLIFLMLGPFYVLQEGQQAIVLQFGRIVNSKRDAGLWIKAPLIDQVVRFPKKIISWDGEPTRVPTEERQFIWVDTTARWRIEDPELFYQSVTDEAGAQTRLDAVIDSAVKEVISKNLLREAVRSSDVINTIERRNVYQVDSGTPGEDADVDSILGDTYTDVLQPPIIKGRGALADEMLTRAKETAPIYGIGLLDVIIRQIRYSDDLTESVFSRMITERQQVAQAFRSDGEGQKADWLGQRSRELNVVLSAARRRAEEIKGDADAQAANIYAEAYNRDPEFYEFWKAVEAYRMVLPKFRKTLTTDSEFFKYLYNQEGQLAGP